MSTPREAAETTESERFDLQAEQRYRSMTGMDLPRHERAQRARDRAARNREEPEVDLDTLTETLARSMLRHSAFRLAPWDGLTDAGRQRWLNKARPIAEDLTQWHTVRPNDQSALACEIGRVLNSSSITSKEPTE